MTDFIDVLLCLTFGIGFGVVSYVLYALCHLPRYYMKGR